MKEVVFLGSKDLGAKCLLYLLQQCNELKMRVSAVATQPHPSLDGPTTVAGIAAQHNIPILPSLEQLPSCAIIYSVQYHELLRPRHIAKAKEMALNLHLAPLPEYRGCNQFSFAIMDAAHTFGVSIHQLDAYIDHGALFWEKRFSINEDIWVADLVAMANRAGYALFVQSLPAVAKGQYTAIDTSSRTSAIHYRKEIDELKKLSLDMPAAECERRIRATSMPGYAPPYFVIGGRMLSVKPAGE